MMRKLSFLKLLLAKNPINILTVSESWLKPSTIDRELSIDGYSCARKHRLCKVRGESLIYVREGIPFRFVSKFDFVSTDLGSVEILRPKAKKVIVWSIYPPPPSQMAINVEHFFDELSELLQNLSDKDELSVLGDFNISWDATSLSYMRSLADRASKRKLSNLANAHGLEQIND